MVAQLNFSKLSRPGQFLFRSFITRSVFYEIKKSLSIPIGYSGGYSRHTSGIRIIVSLWSHFHKVLELQWVSGEYQACSDSAVSYGPFIYSDCVSLTLTTQCFETHALPSECHQCLSRRYVGCLYNGLLLISIPVVYINHDLDLPWRRSLLRHLRWRHRCVGTRRRLTRRLCGPSRVGSPGLRDQSKTKE